MTDYTNPPLRLAVLISGGGRTLINIQDDINAGRLNAEVAIVIASRGDIKGVERARGLGLPTAVVPRKEYATPADFSKVVFGHIREARGDLVCLAGFLSLLVIPSEFNWRVINIHPALLPDFGGRGMFGHHVHEAVIAAGRDTSGCTVHFADAQYDTGPVILQRTCGVEPGDDPDTLAGRVFEQECLAYPEALKILTDGRVIVKEDNTSQILPPHDDDLVERARSYCDHAHAGQTRHTGEPYATHPAAVADILRRHNVTDPEILAAAYLHDVLEDTNTPPWQLQRTFTPRIADLVEQLTIPNKPTGPEKHAAIIACAKKMDADARLIKLADRLHNVTQMREAWSPEKQSDYAKATVELLETLKPWPNDALAGEVRAAIGSQV